MRLRKILDDQGLSPQELADKSGVSKSSISLYLHGYNEPKTKNAKKMADVLGVNPMYLMGFDEETIEIQEEVNSMEVVSVSTHEKTMLMEYRKLSEDDKERIGKIIQSLM